MAKFSTIYLKTLYANRTSYLGKLMSKHILSDIFLKVTCINSKELSGYISLM